MGSGCCGGGMPKKEDKGQKTQATDMKKPESCSTPTQAKTAPQDTQKKSGGCCGGH